MNKRKGLMTRKRYDRNTGNHALIGAGLAVATYIATDFTLNNSNPGNPNNKTTALFTSIGAAVLYIVSWW